MVSCVSSVVKKKNQNKKKENKFDFVNNRRVDSQRT